MEYRLLIWLGTLSTLTLILFGADKRRAVRHRRRIPESALLAAALLGGGTGGLLGMLLFRHKLRKPPFPLLLSLSALAQACLLLAVLVR